MCFFRKKENKHVPSFRYSPDFDYQGLSYKEALLMGKVQEQDIYDYIAYFNAHEKEIGGQLGEFLGMSDNQYLDWITGSPVTLTEMFQADY